MHGRQLIGDSSGRTVLGLGRSPFWFRVSLEESEYGSSKAKPTDSSSLQMCPSQDI